VAGIIRDIRRKGRDYVSIHITTREKSTVASSGSSQDPESEILTVFSERQTPGVESWRVVYDERMFQQQGKDGQDECK
jgi:hypothetical protein